MLTIIIIAAASSKTTSYCLMRQTKCIIVKMISRMRAEYKTIITIVNIIFTACKVEQAVQEVR
jgi:hypothetical protein